MSSVRIAPSVLGCDQGALRSESLALQKAGADIIHLDVMDGVFVPVLTVGSAVAGSIASSVDIPVDAHLMVERPGNLIEGFARAGCDFITVHVEVSPHLERLLKAIRSFGAGAGVALNPGTPTDFLRWVAPSVDLVLVMTVNPGYGGQKHLGSVHGKIPLIRSILDENGGEQAVISVDGGVNSSNAAELVDLGADVLVAGSFITGSDDPAGAIESLRSGA